MDDDDHIPNRTITHDINGEIRTKTVCYEHNRPIHMDVTEITPQDRLRAAILDEWLRR